MTEMTRVTHNVEPTVKRGVGTDIAVGVTSAVATGVAGAVTQKVVDTIRPDKPKHDKPKK
jgi:hypothetical protein